VGNLDNETARAVQAAVHDERTRMVQGVQRIKWKFLDLARAARETSPTSAKTYEECATMLTDFLLKEIDPHAKTG
jgi:hypothetical protein